MKRVISLKEFSTTPTVSSMLRKDGNNISNAQNQEDAPSNNSVETAPKVAPAEAPKSAPKQEDMFEME